MEDKDRDCVFNNEDRAANMRWRSAMDTLTLFKMANLLSRDVHYNNPEPLPNLRLRKRVRLSQSKNSKCSCGSGKKFKKCCMT